MRKLSGLLLLLAATTSNALESKDGKVPLRNRKNSLIGLVDLQDYSAPESHPKKPSYMLLSLYNNETFFADNKCLGFTNYNCAEEKCQEQKDDKFVLNDPFYKGSGYKIKGEAILDYQNWRVSHENPIHLLNECKDNDIYPETENTVGMLGLGTAGNAKKNFGSSVKSFMVKFEDQSASLQFNPTVTPAEEDIQVKFKADENWRVSHLTAVKIINREFHINLNLMFDTNTEGISLPLNVFKKVIRILERRGITCSGQKKESHGEAGHGKEGGHGQEGGHGKEESHGEAGHGKEKENHGQQETHSQEKAHEETQNKETHAKPEAPAQPEAHGQEEDTVVFEGHGAQESHGTESKGSESLSNAICHKVGLVRDLPIIYIVSGDVELPIYPQIYVKNGKALADKTVSSFTLNIRGLTSAKSEKDDHVSHRFNNYIILGDSFLSYYDTVFDLENKEIRISGARSHQAAEDKAKKIVHVMVVCALIVLIMYGVYIAYMRIKAKQLNQAIDKDGIQSEEDRETGLLASFKRMVSSKK